MVVAEKYAIIFFVEKIYFAKKVTIFFIGVSPRYFLYRRDTSTRGNVCIH